MSARAERGKRFEEGWKRRAFFSSSLLKAMGSEGFVFLSLQITLNSQQNLNNSHSSRFLLFPLVLPSVHPDRFGHAREPVPPQQLRQPPLAPRHERGALVGQRAV